MSFLDNILNRVRSGAIRMAQRTHRPRTEPPTPQAVSARLKRENPIAFKDSELKDKGYAGLSNLEKIKMRDKIRKQGDEVFSSGSSTGKEMLDALRRGTAASRETQGITYGDRDADILKARKKRLNRKQALARGKGGGPDSIPGEDDELPDPNRFGAGVYDSTYYGSIAKLIRESFQLNEKKLCARGKSAAKRKFSVYPSAYANMYASAVCSGKVKPGGKKK
jgi:hypothetical protein